MDVEVLLGHHHGGHLGDGRFRPSDSQIPLWTSHSLLRFINSALRPCPSLYVGFVAVPASDANHSSEGINAFAFMLASRVIHPVLPDTRVWNINNRWLTKLFVSADIVCFIVQAGGSSLMSSTNKEDPQAAILL